MCCTQGYFRFRGGQKRLLRMVSLMLSPKGWEGVSSWRVESVWGDQLGPCWGRIRTRCLRGRGGAYEGSQCCLGLIWMQPGGVPGKIHKVWRHAPSLDISPSCLCKCGLERCREMRHDKEATLALELAPGVSLLRRDKLPMLDTVSDPTSEPWIPFCRTASPTLFVTCSRSCSPIGVEGRFLHSSPALGPHHMRCKLCFL